MSGGLQTPAAAGDSCPKAGVSCPEYKGMRRDSPTPPNTPPLRDVRDRHNGMEFVDREVTGTYGAERRVRERWTFERARVTDDLCTDSKGGGATAVRTKAHYSLSLLQPHSMLPRSYQRPRPYRRRVARKRPKHPSRHGHAHTTRPRSRAQPPSTGPPCTHELRCQRERRRHQIATASACSAALAQTFERKITMPPPTDPRAPPCERKDRKQPAHGTVYVPPWVEMERPSQPNVAHMDAIQRQLRRKRARNPRGSPVGSTREPRHLRLPNAPSTLGDGGKQ